jgi:hypothetical protein
MKETAVLWLRIDKLIDTAMTKSTISPMMSRARARTMGAEKRKRTLTGFRKSSAVQPTATSIKKGTRKQASSFAKKKFVLLIGKDI